MEYRLHVHAAVEGAFQVHYKQDARTLSGIPLAGQHRELQNVIERAVMLCDGETFSVDESWLRQESAQASSPVVPLLATLLERERQMIEEAIARSKGRISGPNGAARKLGLPRQTLKTRIASLGIDKH